MKKFWKAGEEAPLPTGEWELHPCVLPGIDEIGDFELTAVIGNTWRCACGRRWLLEDILAQETWIGSERLVNQVPQYQELMDLSERELELLREER